MATIADAAFLKEEHLLFREQVRRFVGDKLAPHVDEWEREKTFPRDVYRQLGAAGYLGVGYDEEYGGAGGDLLHALILAEELCRSGSPGLGASLGSLCIAMPPVVHAGTEAQKKRWLPKVLSGEWIAALAVTEPGTGSDAGAVRTRARLDGDEFVVNGAKTFITSGTRADYLTAVVRTGESGPGGISLIGIETDRPGFTVAGNMDKMGWHASDTAELVFEEMRVPTDCLIGPLNGGFGVLMQNFAGERLLLAISCVAIAQLAFEHAKRYAEERQVFGRPVSKFQVNRHKLAEMATGIDVCRTYVFALATRVMAGEMRLAEVAMAKNAATDMASRVVDQAVQLHGGYGYMREYLVERLYRDIRLYPIGGGTREIMNEIISRQLD
jgi:acyl-CoA dehydrogenase